MNPITLNLVVLHSADLERAARFYEYLGLQFTRHRHGSGPEHLSAELGGSVFELYLLPSNGASTLGTRIGFLVPSLEIAIAALCDFPAAIISPPQDSRGAVAQSWQILTGIASNWRKA